MVRLIHPLLILLSTSLPLSLTSTLPASLVLDPATPVLDKRITCPSGRANCNTVCCDPAPSVPPGNIAQQPDVCGLYSKSRCCPPYLPFGIANNQGVQGAICCPSSDYNNCDGQCCYGTCIFQPSRPPFPPSAYCQKAKGPCNTPNTVTGIACSANSDCTSLTRGTCPSGGGCCYSSPA